MKTLWFWYCPLSGTPGCPACRSGLNVWTRGVFRRAADKPVMISIPKMSLPEVLKNSPWRHGFGRVVQQNNLAPVLNSHLETVRGCAGLELAWDLSSACGGRQTIVVLKPTSPGTQPIKRSSGIPGEPFSSPACELLELPFSALQGMSHVPCGWQPREDFCRLLN